MLVLLNIDCSHGKPVLRIDASRGEQGGVDIKACEVATRWRAPGMPHLELWADADCPTRAPLTIEFYKPTDLCAASEVEQSLHPRMRTKLETPSFRRPVSGTAIGIRVATECESGGKIWATTECVMP
jgi:hypothetical protein